MGTVNDIHSEAYWTDQACEVWKKVTRRPSECQFAVYVTETGIDWCKIGGPTEKRYTTNFGHGLVGIYDRKVQLGWFVDDVLHTAGRLGLIPGHGDDDDEPSVRSHMMPDDIGIED